MRQGFRLEFSLADEGKIEVSAVKKKIHVKQESIPVECVQSAFFVSPPHPPPPPPPPLDRDLPWTKTSTETALDRNPPHWTETLLSGQRPPSEGTWDQVQRPLCKEHGTRQPDRNDIIQRTPPPGQND